MPSLSHPLGITRNRQRLACEPCRRRKLRCDRGTPCGACARRDEGPWSCSYQRFATSQDHHTGETDGRRRVESRLEHLERAVQHLASRRGGIVANETSSGQPGSLSEGAPMETAGNLADLGEGSPKTFVPQRQNTSAVDAPLHHHGATHWAAVLEDIHELRLSISADDRVDDLSGHDISRDTTHTQATDPDDRGIGLLFGSHNDKRITFNSILSAYLPPKQNVDRLTSTYFRTQSLAAPFIHSKSFQKKYSAFWADPWATSPLWTSMLFSICYISATILRPTPARDMLKEGNRFVTASALCLAAGSYHLPQPYAVEALLLYVQSLCLTCRVLPPAIAPVSGVLVRLACMMGYHEKRHISRLPPFAREMRRRAWSLCMQLDLLISFHLGLPSSVPPGDHVTKPPLNLLDSDFDEESMELPPPRPDSEINGIMFVATKHKFMVVFYKILRHALTVPSESTLHIDTMELEKLDAELLQVSANLPELLRPRPMSDSVFDSSTSVVTRLCVLFLHSKCQCVLHRPYMLRGRAESLRACHGAAANMLEGFCDGYGEIAAHGQFETEAWFMTSLTWHDFLLGAVTLCLATVVGLRSSCIAADEVAKSKALLARALDVSAGQESERSEATGRVNKLLQSTLHRLSFVDGFALDMAVPMAAISDVSTMGGSIDRQTPWEPGSLAVDQAMGLENDSLWDGYLEQFLDIE